MRCGEVSESISKSSSICRAILFALAFLALFVVACSDGGDDENGGDKDFEPEAEADKAVCEDGVSGCEGALAIICVNGKWQQLTDCGKNGETCEKGICVPIPVDGDDESDIEGADEDKIEIEIEDVTPPKVDSTVPRDGQTDLELIFGTVLINFTEVMSSEDIGLINRAVNLTGHCNKELLITPRLTAGGKQLEITIREPLHSGTEHFVTLNPDLWFDLAGNPLGPFSFSFTSIGDPPVEECADADPEEEAEDLPPEVTQTIPYDGEMGVDIEMPSVKVKFSEQMDHSNYDETSKITFESGSGHAPEWEASWFADDSWLALNLNEDLEDDSLYTVTVAEGLKDTTGNALGSFSISFSTADAPVDGDMELDPELEPELEADGGGDNPPPDNLLKISDSYRSPLGDTPYNPVHHPTSVEASWQSGKIVVLHKNVPYDAGLTNVTVEIEQIGWNIVLTETTNVNILLEEDYPFDVTVEIINAISGSYNVSIYADEAIEPETTTVDVP